MTPEFIIGVDVGGTRTKAGLVNIATGEVVQANVQATEKNDAQLFVAQLDSAIENFKRTAAQIGGTVSGIGIGVPGFTTAGGQVLTTYGAVSFMENYPLKQVVEERFSIPCSIDNDARAVALGEAVFGKGKGFDRVLVLTLGTGVGFGFVVSGRFSDAAPFSHMGGNMVVTSTGGECYCGKSGCLEALVSSSGIIHLSKEAGLENIASSQTVFELAASGNGIATQVVDQVIQYLHTAIHNYTNLFAPDIIVLGGGIAKNLSPYLDKIKGRSYMGPYPGYDFRLTVSSLQEEAGVLGCAALLTHRHQKPEQQ